MDMFAKNMRLAVLWLTLLLAASLTVTAYAAKKSKGKDDDDEPAATATVDASGKVDLKRPPLPKSLEERDARVELLSQQKYKDIDTCIDCHDEDNEFPVFPIFKTRHGIAADARTPFAESQKQCEACHGPGDGHAKSKKKKNGTIINFGKKAWTPVKDQNEKCLSCHQNQARVAWKGSSHEFADVACASCHSVHAQRDPILDKRRQDEVCLTCHAKERAKFLQPSHHPVKEGRMACTDCHDVHGGHGSGAQVKATQRDKCVSCHAEKRGPFLWEHAPAAEDCLLCHTPHGSVQAALLKKRPPLLCQECHSAAHAGMRLDGAALGALSQRAFLGAKGCVNCHSQVHGANHPSGATMFR